jgi:Protein of unknown function (DUF3631)/Domain of unknown function (DUF3854)
VNGGDAAQAPDYGSGLLPQHQHLLKASAIGEDVARARGYVSADTKAQLRRFGFTASQQLPPALVIPLWTVTGGRGGYQCRPDDPRQDPKTGRVVKYETPGKARMVLDVHPFVRPHLGDPSRPLFVTEGVRKGDALVGIGLDAIALAGVWCWRGQNGQGGRAALPDWEHVALDGRVVHIVFDSDVSLSPAVHEAMRRLKAFLELRGAVVSVVYLPPGAAGEKVGVDDFIAAGNGPAELLKLAVPDLRRAPDDGDERAEEEALAELLERCPEEPGHRVLDDVAAFISRFVAFPQEHHVVTLALWVAHTYTFSLFDSTPRLAITSAERQSGKTRVLEVIETLARGPLRTENISTAALYRLVELREPTLLFDEIDTIFGDRAGNHEELRGVLNAGHRKGAVVYRCVGEGAQQQVQAFRVFAPVALAGIGRLPDTLADRSIPIRLRRRAPDELVAPFRFREVEAPAAPLRDRLHAWAARVAEALDGAQADMPPGVTDRPADVWEPLLVLADAAGGEWPRRARDAAVALVGQAQADEPSMGLRLLADIRRVFDDRDGDRILSRDLANALKALDESPWGDDSFRPLTPVRLARLLKAYDIDSKSMRVGAEHARGYERERFEDAWKRYRIPAPSSSGRDNGTEPKNESPPADTSVPSSSGVPPQLGTTTDRPDSTRDTAPTRDTQTGRSAQENEPVTRVPAGEGRVEPAHAPSPTADDDDGIVIRPDRRRRDDAEPTP